MNPDFPLDLSIFEIISLHISKTLGVRCFDCPYALSSEQILNNRIITGSICILLRDLWLAEIPVSGIDNNTEAELATYGAIVDLQKIPDSCPYEIKPPCEP